MMTEAEKQRLIELRDEHFRKSRQQALQERLEIFFPEMSFTFLSPEFSRAFRNQAEPWPEQKWEKELYIQTPMTDPGIISTIVGRFIQSNQFDHSFVRFVSFDSELARIDNNFLLLYWAKLIEADGNDICCFLPERSEYIYLEKTEEMMVDKEDSGRLWIFEVTFSNEKLKSELLSE